MAPELVAAAAWDVWPHCLCLFPSPQALPPREPTPPPVPARRPSLLSGLSFGCAAPSRPPSPPLRRLALPLLRCGVFTCAVLLLARHRGRRSPSPPLGGSAAHQVRVHPDYGTLAGRGSLHPEHVLMPTNLATFLSRGARAGAGAWQRAGAQMASSRNLDAFLPGAAPADASSARRSGASRRSLRAAARQSGGGGGGGGRRRLSLWGGSGASRGSSVSASSSAAADGPALAALHGPHANLLLELQGMLAASLMPALRCFVPTMVERKAADGQSGAPGRGLAP